MPSGSYVTFWATGTVQMGTSGTLSNTAQVAGSTDSNAANDSATVNVDGFGIGWYLDDGEPGIYTNPMPIWSDTNLPHLAQLAGNHLNVARNAVFLVHRDGERIDLTRTEFALLELLLERPGQVMTRDQIYEHVWGYDSSTSSNSLEVYVGYLRRKTEIGDRPRLVHTVRGVGYVIRDA